MNFFEYVDVWLLISLLGPKVPGYSQAASTCMRSRNIFSLVLQARLAWYNRRHLAFSKKMQVDLNQLTPPLTLKRCLLVQGTMALGVCIFRNLLVCIGPNDRATFDVLRASCVRIYRYTTYKVLRIASVWREDLVFWQPGLAAYLRAWNIPKGRLPLISNPQLYYRMMEDAMAFAINHENGLHLRIFGRQSLWKHDPRNLPIPMSLRESLWVRECEGSLAIMFRPHLAFAVP